MRLSPRFPVVKGWTKGRPRTGGHVYFTAVTNLLSGRVVWIGDGKGEKGFSAFLEALGERGRRRIRGARERKTCRTPDDDRPLDAEGAPAAG